MKSMKHQRTFISLFRVLSVTCVILSALTIPHSRGQEATSSARGVDKAELHQALLDLTNAATVMCVAAHPDDEDGTTLTVLRRKYGVHTVSLFSTYGEGGQNAVGPELYEALGVIRARETMEASRIQGSEPHFLALKDFGFSKSAEETFRVWGKEEALRRIVFKIRELRPDVIITNHDTTTGHGHHQATGRLVLDAFDAAADPQRFPEQLSQVSVWQPSRLFVRSRNPTATSNSVASVPNDKFISVDPNEQDPLRGNIYAAQALMALQKHASQGPWPTSIADRLRGNPSGKLPLVRYRLAREASGVASFPADAKTFLDGLQITPLLAAPTIEGRALTEILDQPDRVLNALIDWRRRAVAPLSKDSQRARLMAQRRDKALAVAAGVMVAISSQVNVLLRGAPTRFIVNITNTKDRNVHIKKLTFEGWGNVIPLDAAELLSADTETITPVDLVTLSSAAITVPAEEHLYDDLLFGHRFVAQADLEIDGAKFSVKAAKSLNVAPVVEITKISPSPCVQSEQTLARCNNFQVTLTNHLAKPFTGSLTVARTVSGHVRETAGQLELAPGETRTQMFSNADARPSRETVSEERRSASVLVSINPPILAGSTSAPAGKPISEREVRVIYTDARVTTGLRVGYVPSFDQTLKQSFDALGVGAEEVKLPEIKEGNLSRYNSIIIDNRGYYAHPELIAGNAQLMKYVEDGGTLIVFYHKDSEWNPNPDRGRPQLAPYPIILGDERVTEEVAPIKFLQPSHALLNSPNKIRSADFNNWIQERGLYYPKEWDSHYTAVFASNDKGEKPLGGGLLVARYGRGNYIFTSMVWYRQLAAGVPGAYRMLANMISYPRRQ